MQSGANLHILLIEEAEAGPNNLQALLNAAIRGVRIPVVSAPATLFDYQEDQPDILIVGSFLQSAPGTFISKIEDKFPEAAILVLTDDVEAELQGMLAAKTIDHFPRKDLTAGLLSRLIFYSIERKKNAIYLNDTRERYSVLTKATNNIVWDWELSKRRAYWAGSGLQTILGYDQFEMIVNTDFWENNLHPEDRDRVISRLEKMFEEGHENKWEDEYRLKTKTGEYCHIYDRGFIIYKDLKPVRMIGSMEDITERKLAIAASLSSEQNYKSLFDNNPLPTFIWDLATFKVINANSAALQEYGYTREEFLALTVFDLRPANERESFKRFAETAIASGNVQKDFTWTHVNKAGEHILMEISSYAVQYDGRRAVLALAKNVTERQALQKKLEAEKTLRQQQITEAVVTAQEKERTEIGKELHDNVNQLLSASRLYIEAAKNDERNGISLLSQASEYIMNAIEEIRVLSKALNTPLISELGLKDSVRNLADDLMAVYQIGISVEDERFDEAGLHENFKLTLFRIIQEQVTNILKHSKATEAIIELKRGREEISLHIRDNGIGFDTSMRRKGIGLGNIHSRAALYKGRLEIQSQKGKGTSLSVEFPEHETLDDALKLIS